MYNVISVASGAYQTLLGTHEHSEDSQGRLLQG